MIKELKSLTKEDVITIYKKSFSPETTKSLTVLFPKKTKEKFNLDSKATVIKDPLQYKKTAEPY